MHCESCWTGGYSRETVVVDPVRRIFVGPCCLENRQSDVEVLPPAREPELEYGVEFSSKRGIVAFVRYGGFSAQYHKPPEVIDRWFQEFRPT